MSHLAVHAVATITSTTVAFLPLCKSASVLAAVTTLGNLVVPTTTSITTNPRCRRRRSNFINQQQRLLKTTSLNEHDNKQQQPNINDDKSILSTTNNNNKNRKYFLKNMKSFQDLCPRAQASIYMGMAMSLHYGGYEFLRNSVLALFTSSSTGFQSPIAYPFVNGLISPFSVLLLYLYGKQLETYGPRIALRTTTVWSLGYILITSILLKCMELHMIQVPKVFGQLLVGFTFLFQNSYNYLIATQQWSFVNSVLTPNEGSKWFTVLTGCSSIFCTLTGSLVPFLVPHTGLLGLFALTSITLFGTLLCQDKAYQLSVTHGFDPSVLQMKKIKESKQQKEQEQQMKKENMDSTTGTTTVDSKENNNNNNNITNQALGVFQRVPTLRALFLEVVSFQSLNTILTIVFIESMKKHIPNDVARSAYSSQFYAYVNGSAATLQFFILPFVMKQLEPKQIWRMMPLIPFLVCMYQVFKHGNVPLTILALAVYVTKTMDYSIRSVVYNMVYQPLDYESRFVGKEIIGVFGSRFGKSGMSILISGFTYIGILKSMVELSYLSLSASTLWITSTWWLSTLIPTKIEAQKIVEKRLQSEKKKE